VTPPTEAEHRAKDRPQDRYDARLLDLIRKRYSPLAQQAVLRGSSAAKHGTAPRVY
jgi:hypothetical protein